MWKIENKTPFPAQGSMLLDAQGDKVWALAVRATFDIARDGKLTLSDEQEPVRPTDEYVGESSTSALRYPTDLVLESQGTDVLLHGHAYAPRRKPVDALDVAIEVAGWRKTVRVFGERLWYQVLLSLKTSATKPFVTMPLGYDRAWGGRDPQAKDPNAPTGSPYNPIGKGFAQASRTLSNTLMPNLGTPGQKLEPGPTLMLPAGFGPIAPYWGQRRRYGGTYDERWKRERMPLLPEDFSARFYRSAPPDQQFTSHLNGAEDVTLDHLTEAGSLGFALPGVSCVSRVWFGDEEQEQLANLHTVILEPDYPRVQLVWHSAFECENKDLFKKAQVHVQGDTPWL